MKIIKMSDIDHVIVKEPSIKLCQEATDSYAEENGYNRTRVFYVGDEDEFYKIVWWKNLSYFHYRGIMIPFHWMTVTSSWPNDHEMDLQLFYGQSQNTPTAVIKLR